MLLKIKTLVPHLRKIVVEDISDKDLADIDVIFFFENPHDPMGINEFGYGTKTRKAFEEAYNLPIGEYNFPV